MAITFDSFAAGGFKGPGTGLTWTHTTSGINRQLFVGVLSQSGDVVTGTTYNSVSLTQVSKVNSSGTEWEYLYYLNNPASGANSVLVNVSGSSFYQACSSSYNGVVQSNPIDVSSTGTGTGSVPLTTTIDNDWMVAFIRSSTSATSNCVLRGSANGGSGVDDGGGAIYDTNSAQTPAGLHTMTISIGTSAGFVVSSFKPIVTAAVATGSFLLKMI